MATQLVKEQIEALAFDIAQGYFNDQQMCIRYSITIGQLNHLREQDPFKREVDEVKRILEDGGEQFVYKARKMAVGALETLDEIRTDDDATNVQKAAAANAIIECAGVKKKPSDATGGGLRLSIHTNLNIGTEGKGVYVVEARPTYDNEAQGVIERAPRELKKLAKVVDDGRDLI
jgi:hypothetical protein